MTSLGSEGHRSDTGQRRQRLDRLAPADGEVGHAKRHSLGQNIRRCPRIPQNESSPRSHRSRRISLARHEGYSASMKAMGMAKTQAQIRAKLRIAESANALR